VRNAAPLGQMQGAEARIVNVVATADLRQPLSLMRVSELKYVEYDQAKYRGRVAYFKSPGMEGKVTIFSTGKLISVGTRSVQRAERELEAAVSYLLENGLTKKVRVVVRVRNMVVSLDTGHLIDIEGLYSRIPNLVYEPEQFPAAIWRPASVPGTTVLVYSNGKLIIAGLVQTDGIDMIIGELEHSSSASRLPSNSQDC
jgi:TATA-box binding protein (TBP) (component of TFIID and TFIIIB)